MGSSLSGGPVEFGMNDAAPAPNGHGLTEEQARAAFAAGSVAVVAGAGTGKTKMLANRYLHHLDGGLSPLEIVAVTFTEKAAELRSRIRELVRQERPSARRAAVELEAAQISTFHALAARICREHPESAGVPADFRVLEDLDRAIWRAERLEEALLELPAELLEALPLDLLQAVLSALLDDPVPAAGALQPDPARWRELLERQRESAVAAVLASPEWASARAAFESYSGAAGDKGEQARRVYLQGMDAFEKGDAAAALSCVDQFRTNVGSKGNWPNGGLDEVKEGFRNVKALIKEACQSGASLQWSEHDDELARLTPLLSRAFEQVKGRMDGFKRRERVLDFADLEVHALRALATPEVRDYYRRRWRAFLVDEFQDTNPVQERILDALTESAIVTVVGDEKQAVYGFRGADVEVFRRYRQKTAGKGGEEVILTRSFRTHKELIEATGTAFSELLGDLHQPITAVRSEAPGDGPFVTFHPIVDKTKAPKSARRLSEAYEIGRQIKEMVEGAETVFDPETKKHRPIRYGDIAILARGVAPFETYSQVLPALGIPTVNTGGGNLFDTREAKDGIAALRFLADPTDNIALAALLRSPFFALDDRTLLELVQAKPQEVSWWETLQLAEDRAWERPRVLLGGLLEQRWNEAPSRLLQLLDRETAYTAIIANLPGAARRLADWRGFLGFVRELEGRQQDAFAVVRQVRMLQQAEVEVPRPTLQAGNSVALMTIHKSKGLEWPVVFVADLSYEGGNNRGEEVLVDEELGVAFKLRDADDERVAPFLFTFLKERRKAAEEEELRRLLYVAMTRARDRLVLTSCEEGKGPLKLLVPALEAAGIPSIKVQHDPSLAFPDAAFSDSAGGELREDLELWQFDARGSGEQVSRALAGGPAAAAVGGPSGWEEVLSVIAAFDESYSPLAQVLAEAGLPAPQPHDLFAELMGEQGTTGYEAVMIWRAEDPPVALVDASVTVDEGSYRLVRYESPAGPEPVVAQLRQLLLSDG